MKTLNTAYTVFGYKCTLDAEQEPIHAGGNDPMCSETILLPRYVGADTPHHLMPLRLADIKKIARTMHDELVKEHGYISGHIYHDRDDQDETLIMLDMDDHPAASARIRAHSKARLKALLEKRATARAAHFKGETA